MIVDRLEILRFEHIGDDPLVRIEPPRDVAHQILDELRILVRALGDELLVGTLQEAP
ncbi:hypothetical protein Y025_5573 [Burkholderia pseudomallei TSV32]|nr:hypothetical protein Y025_5573 [Burkholderia pseudomallei TSV32]